MNLDEDTQVGNQPYPDRSPKCAGRVSDPIPLQSLGLSQWLPSARVQKKEVFKS